MPQMKILVSGAGPAGNAIAFWLSNLGHDVTVIERSPSLRTNGLQVDIRGHGVEVMKRMGLEENFRSKSVPEQGLQIVDNTGRRRAYFPTNRSGKGLQSFTSEWEIMRGDLCLLMYEEAKDQVKYVFGTSIESFEESYESVEVLFTDGKMERFDLVVGADGVGSRTRKMMFGSGPANGFFPLAGLYAAYFTIPEQAQKGEEYMSTLYLASRSRCIMTRRSNSDQLQVYMSGVSNSGRFKNVRPRAVRGEKETVADMFRGAGWRVKEILKSMKDADDFYCERMGLVKLESWSKGHVTLVGDAAYCPSANTGMGTTSSIVGAYVLAGEIARHCGGSGDIQDGLEIALKAYEEKFRPFTEQVQKGLLENKESSIYPSSALGVGVLNCFLGLASLFKVNVGRWIQKEDVKGWDLPKYNELLKG